MAGAGAVLNGCDIAGPCFVSFFFFCALLLCEVVSGMVEEELTPYTFNFLSNTCFFFLFFR